MFSSTQPPPPPPPGDPNPPGDGGLNFTGAPPPGGSSTTPPGAPPNFNENQNINPPSGNIRGAENFVADSISRDPGTVAPDQASAMTTMIMNSASLMARVAESFERNNPEANKKLSSLLENYLKNLATPDGSIPAEELTAEARLLFKSNQSEADRQVNSWLREANAKVIPSTSLVKALRTGDTTSTGKPDKLSLYSLYTKTQKGRLGLFYNLQRRSKAWQQSI